jgi:hypothetical protein
VFRRDYLACADGLVRDVFPTFVEPKGSAVLTASVFTFCLSSSAVPPPTLKPYFVFGFWLPCCPFSCSVFGQFFQMLRKGLLSSTTYDSYSSLYTNNLRYYVYCSCAICFRCFSFFPVRFCPLLLWLSCLSPLSPHLLWWFSYNT